jgi:hypothetical protein
MRATDDWFDLYEYGDNTGPPLSSRRKWLIPFVALLVAGGAVFTAYAMTQNDGQGAYRARESVLRTLNLAGPRLHMEPVTERDRVEHVRYAEPAFIVQFSTTQAEVNNDRLPEVADEAAVDTHLGTGAAEPETAEPEPAPRRAVAPDRSRTYQKKERSDSLYPEVGTAAEPAESTEERGSSTIEAPMAPDAASERAEQAPSTPREPPAAAPEPEPAPAPEEPKRPAAPAPSVPDYGI